MSKQTRRGLRPSGLGVTPVGEYIYVVMDDYNLRQLQDVFGRDDIDVGDWHGGRFELDATYFSDIPKGTLEIVDAKYFQGSRMAVLQCREVETER